MKNKLFIFINYSFFILLLIYLGVSTYFFLNRPVGAGDESLFINDLILIKEIGWIEAIKESISIPYMLLAYPFSLILEEYIALRFVNILLLIITFFYFFKIDNRTSLKGYFYIIFYLSTVGFFYYGTNDTLFFISLIIFINEVYRAAFKKTFHLNIALTALVICIFTRELFVIYFPIIIFGFYIFFKTKIKFSKRLQIPIYLLIFLFVLNIPSLLQNGHFSYDNKKPPKGIEVSWSQRQYLAQLMVNKGELNNFQHPSWEETQNYIQIHGKESLPDGIIKSLIHDFNVTFKEFFKDLVYVLIYSSRSLGIILLINTLFFIVYTVKHKKVDNFSFVPIITLMMISIFSLIIISYVEMRWLAPVFIMSIIFYSDLEKNHKIPNILKYSNRLIMILFSIYGIINLTNKIQLFQ
ncbi:hypothetical protein [Planktosalinus lacus]|uniref:Uncharacterized protein n=1 Tax=Planktosalinus lacus TaxID=1526573 RepID=A0A8J2Y5E0_9FLAO|nr:hypothetical protein [Planktosalinus lacus]GGD84743.1 hypothetical protein GCM10011312_05940 [Planktosalinus lacus]